MARPRDPEIDRRIVEACMQLLDEKGRAHLTREQIAQRAGVSLPAMTRRYRTVDEIVLQMARTAPHPRPLGVDEEAPLREFLVASLLRTVRTLGDAGIRRSAAELLAAAAGDIRIDEALRASLAALRTEGVDRIRRAVDSGELRPDTDPDTLLDLLAAAAYYRLLWRGQLLDETEVPAVVDLLLSGAAPHA